MTPFQAQIAKRIFQAANNHRIYCPEILVSGDRVTFKWDNDDHYIHATIVEHKKTILYHTGDKISEITHNSNLNVNSIQNMFCAFSLFFYG